MSVFLGLDARSRLLRGACKLSALVSFTYGPNGKTIIIDRFGGLLASKDGHTVAHEVDFSDPLESMGAKILRQACMEVNNKVGDGTTTTAILAQALIQEGHKHIIAGADQQEFFKGLQDAKDKAIELIRLLSFESDDVEVLKGIARISSNYDEEISMPLLQACLDVGKYGTVVVEDGYSTEVSYELHEGIELDQGYASHHFINDMDRMVSNLDGPLVALVATGLQSCQDVVSLLEEGSAFRRPLLVIAPYIEGEALGTMILNKEAVPNCAVKVPGVGVARKREVLEDLASMSGATVIAPDLGMDIKNFKTEWFGAFRKAQVYENKTLLRSYDDHEEAISNRVRLLNKQLELTEDEFDSDLIRKRMAKLAEGFAVIKVGGHTEAEMKERRARIEDSLGSIQSAIRDGVCLGGGTTYLQVSCMMENKGFEEGSFWYNIGRRTLTHILCTPMKKLLGESERFNIDHIKSLVLTEDKAWWGLDVKSNAIRDFKQPPWIVDPCHLLVTALETAVSIATLFLSVDCAITSR